MVSAIDSTVIIDDQDVSKNQLRAQLDIAKTEISALQALISGDSILEGGLNISIAGTIDFPSVTLPVNETKRMVAFDNSSAAQTIRFLVDDASFLALPDNVLLMLVRCTSAANSLSITTNTAGRLRTNNYLDTAFHNTQVDTVFLGYSRAKQTGLWLPIYKDGGFVFIDGPVRQNDTDDFAIVPNRDRKSVV